MSSKLSLAGCGLFVASLATLTFSCAGKSSSVTRAERQAQLAPACDAGISRDLLDEGPHSNTCSQSDGIVTSGLVNFETGANQWFPYDDGTGPTGLLKALGTGPAFTAPATWSNLVTQDLSIPEPTHPDVPAIGVRCPGTPQESLLALHVVGGPYTGYGGGFGTTGFFDLSGELETTYGDTVDTLVTAVGLDLSSYKGISFWARRGPVSQGNVSVVLFDKYVTAEANRLMANHLVDPVTYATPAEGPYCPQARDCGCAAGKQCQAAPFDATLTYCWDPAIEPPPEVHDAAAHTAGTIGPDPSKCTCGTPCNLDESAMDGGVLSPTYVCWDPAVDPPGGKPDGAVLTPYVNCAKTVDYPKCEATACAGDPAKPDLLIDNSACTAYTTSDGIAGKFCYDPGTQDRAPTPGNMRCGGGWSASVALSSEWKFYRVPFNEMAQGGYGWQAPGFGLDSIWALSFTFGSGAVDFYIDDIGVYR